MTPFALLFLHAKLVPSRIADHGGMPAHLVERPWRRR
jgi:hypothetical protein